MKVRASFGLDLVHPVLVGDTVRYELNDVKMTVGQFDVVLRPIVQPKTEIVEDQNLTAKYVVTLRVDVSGCIQQRLIDWDTHMLFHEAAAQGARRVLKHVRKQTTDWKIDVRAGVLRTFGYWDCDGMPLKRFGWEPIRIDASFLGGLTGQKWDGAVTASAQGADTDLLDDWLFEAQAFRDAGERVMAVVAAAVACEIGTVRLLRSKPAAMGSIASSS